MKLAIIAVFLILGYIIWTNLQKIIANRKEANAQGRQQDLQCDSFTQELAKLDQAHKIFTGNTNHLGQTEQQWLWSNVIDNKVRACHFLLSHDFARATVYLTLATEKANSLIAQYSGITA